MQHIAKAYFSLTGEAPSEETIQRLSKIQAALQIPETDALWSVFIAFDLYLSMYENIPDEIRQTNSDILSKGSKVLSEVLMELVNELDAKYQNYISGLEGLLTKFKADMVAAQARGLVIAYFSVGLGALLGGAIGYGIWDYHLTSARKDEASTIRRVEVAKQYLSDTLPIVRNLRQKYSELEAYGIGLVRIEDGAILVRVPAQSSLHEGSLKVYSCMWSDQADVPCIKLEPNEIQ